MELEFKEGDPCWIHIGGKENPLVKGEVVKKIKIKDYPFDYYVIELDTGIDSVFEVREGSTMSDSPYKPIGFWRNLWRSL